jgi:hypothetical protein
MLLGIMRLLEIVSVLMPKTALDLFGNGFGLIAVLFVAVLIAGITGLLGYRMIRTLFGRKPQTTSGQKAFERLSRRV